MHKKLLALLIVLSPALVEAQIGGLLKKAKAKVEQRIEKKSDAEMDKAWDQLEGKPTASNNSTPPSPAPAAPAANTTAAAPPKEEKETIKSYSRFDFVPGEKFFTRKILRRMQLANCR